MKKTRVSLQLVRRAVIARGDRAAPGLKFSCLAPDLAGDFDPAAAEQAFRFGGGARRVCLAREKLAISRVHGVEIVEVGQVHVHSDDGFPLKLEFVEDAAYGRQHRAGLGGNIAKRRDALGEIGRNQAGKECVMLIQNHLAERRRRSGDRVRLNAGQWPARGRVSQ